MNWKGYERKRSYSLLGGAEKYHDIRRSGVLRFKQIISRIEIRSYIDYVKVLAPAVWFRM
jgi:hypothetical protein